MATGMARQNPRVSPPVVMGTAGESVCMVLFFLHHLSMAAGAAGQNPQVSPPVVVGTAGESTLLLSIILAVHGFAEWLARILRLLHLSTWEQQVSR